MDWEKIIPERYRISYDRATGSFRILDTWHESIKNLPDLDGEIPDNSLAVKILNTLEVNTLIGELGKMGWLDKFISDSGTKIMAAPIVKSKTIGEIAVDRIAEIVKDTAKSVGADEAVSREGILAIREIAQKI